MNPYLNVNKIKEVDATTSTSFIFFLLRFHIGRYYNIEDNICYLLFHFKHYRTLVLR